MKASLRTLSAMAVAIGCAISAGCDRDTANAADGVQQTKFPGQLTAGGLTSGQVMARTARPETNAVYGGGSPFIAGGSGGNTGGAALGGTVAETGEGPSRGVTDPTGAMQGGNKPPGDFGAPPANAPMAGVTPVGAGAASNQENTPAGARAPGSAATDQQATPPAAPPAATNTQSGGK